MHGVRMVSEAVVVENDRGRRARIRIRAQRRLVVAVRRGRRLVLSRVVREAERVRRRALQKRHIADDRAAAKLVRRDLDTRPVNRRAEAVRSRERQHGDGGIVRRRIVLHMEHILVEVARRLHRDVLCIDIQRIARDVARIAAAVERNSREIRPVRHRRRQARRIAAHACSAVVAEVDRVARRRARARRAAAVDVARDRAARERDRAPGHIARARRIAAVDIARHRAACDSDIVFRHIARARRIAAADIARHRAARNPGVIFRHVARARRIAAGDIACHRAARAPGGILRHLARTRRMSAADIARHRAICNSDVVFRHIARAACIASGEILRLALFHIDVVARNDSAVRRISDEAAVDVCDLAVFQLDVHHIVFRAACRARRLSGVSGVKRSATLRSRHGQLIVLRLVAVIGNAAVDFLRAALGHGRLRAVIGMTSVLEAVHAQVERGRFHRAIVQYRAVIRKQSAFEAVRGAVVHLAAGQLERTRHTALDERHACKDIALVRLAPCRQLVRVERDVRIEPRRPAAEAILRDRQHRIAVRNILFQMELIFFKVLHLVDGGVLCLDRKRIAGNSRCITAAEHRACDL